MLAQIEPFWSWHTPIAWTGYILFVDGLVWQQPRRVARCRTTPPRRLFIARGQHAAVGRLRGVQQVPRSTTGTTSGSPKTLLAPLHRLRLGVRDDLAGDLRDGRAGRRAARSARAVEDAPSGSRRVIPLGAAGMAERDRGSDHADRCRSSIRRTGSPRPCGSASSFCWIRSTRRAAPNRIRGDLARGPSGRLVNLLDRRDWSAASSGSSGTTGRDTKWIYTVPVPPHVKIFEMPHRRLSRISAVRGRMFRDVRVRPPR